MAPWEGKTLLVNAPTMDKSNIFFHGEAWKKKKKSREVVSYRLLYTPHNRTAAILLMNLSPIGNMLIYFSLSTMKLQDLIHDYK